MTEFIILGNTIWLVEEYNNMRKNDTIFIEKQPNAFDHKTTIHETRV